jgi:cation diffusion facilitator CzcD-associated flavoprotein CzcO
LETNRIDHIDADDIVTSDGRKTIIDTLVLATGFDLWDANFPAIEVVGRDGRNLGKWWRENRFKTYEGVSVPYFPNFLNLASPYAFTGASYFTMIWRRRSRPSRARRPLHSRVRRRSEIRDRKGSQLQRDPRTHWEGARRRSTGHCWLS